MAVYTHVFFMFTFLNLSFKEQIEVDSTEQSACCSYRPIAISENFPRLVYPQQTSRLFMCRDVPMCHPLVAGYYLFEKYPATLAWKQGVFLNFYMK